MARLFSSCDDLYVRLLAQNLMLSLFGVHEMVLLISVQGFTFFSDLLGILRCFGLLHLQALKLVILE